MVSIKQAFQGMMSSSKNGTVLFACDCEDEKLFPLVKEAINLSEILSQKQQAYGDAFGLSGKVMEILYPEGIKPEQYKDALTIVRIVDKLFRIANQKDAFGEDPWQDIAGYALLSSVRNKMSNNK